MRSTSISRYIRFGTSFRYLQDAAIGWSIHKDDCVLANIDRFLAEVVALELTVTDRAATKLKMARATLSARPKDARLTPSESGELKSIMRELRPTLFAEAQGNVAFITTDKRLQVTKLLGEVRGLMAPGVFDAMPEIARYDFGEAGKCIAFERPTAAAFHLLRGTEAVLRHFYCSIVKRGRGQLMWGPIVGALRKRRDTPDPTLLNHLDNIRASFRNPTQHPEKIYDINEAQDLFGLCVESVNRMVRNGAWDAIAIAAAEPVTGTSTT